MADLLVYGTIVKDRADVLDAMEGTFVVMSTN